MDMISNHRLREQQTVAEYHVPDSWKWCNYLNRGAVSLESSENSNGLRVDKSASELSNDDDDWMDRAESLDDNRIEAMKRDYKDV